MNLANRRLVALCVALCLTAQSATFAEEGPSSPPRQCETLFEETAEPSLKHRKSQSVGQLRRMVYAMAFVMGMTAPLQGAVNPNLSASQECYVQELTPAVPTEENLGSTTAEEAELPVDPEPQVEPSVEPEAGVEPSAEPERVAEAETPETTPHCLQPANLPPLLQPTDAAQAGSGLPLEQAKEYIKVNLGEKPSPQLMQQASGWVMVMALALGIGAIKLGSKVMTKAKTNLKEGAQCAGTLCAASTGQGALAMKGSKKESRRSRR